MSLTLNIERRRRLIHELVIEALNLLEISGNVCDPLNCICGGLFARCPQREEEDVDHLLEDIAVSDPEMNVSSDEGYDN